MRTKATLWRSALILLLIACSVVSAQARKPIQAESTNPTNTPIEKTPAVAAHHPLVLELEIAVRTPSVEMPHYLEAGIAAKTPWHPSVAIPLPLEVETAAKTPWHPSVAIPLPLEVEARAATLSFQLAQESAVEIVIYSVNGRVVRTLADRHFSMGSHSVEWDGLDDGGSRTASGVYFARLRAGEQFGKGKLLLVR